jgi:hypothetical protein
MRGGGVIFCKTVFSKILVLAGAAATEHMAILKPL